MKRASNTERERERETDGDRQAKKKKYAVSLNWHLCSYNIGLLRETY